MQSYEEITTIPALIGVLFALQNLLTVPKIIRNRHACSIRLYSLLPPLLCGLLFFNLLSINFKLTMDDSPFDDPLWPETWLSDRDTYLNIGLILLGLLGVRLLFSITVNHN